MAPKNQPVKGRSNPARSCGAPVRYDGGDSSQSVPASVVGSKNKGQKNKSSKNINSKNTVARDPSPDLFTSSDSEDYDDEASDQDSTASLDHDRGNTLQNNIQHASHMSRANDQIQGNQAPVQNQAQGDPSIVTNAQLLQSIQTLTQMSQTMNLELEKLKRNQDDMSQKIKQRDSLIAKKRISDNLDSGAGSSGQKGQPKKKRSKGPSKQNVPVVQDDSDEVDDTEGETDDESNDALRLHSRIGHSVGATVAKKYLKCIMEKKFVEFSELLPKYGVYDHSKDEFTLKSHRGKTTFVRGRNVRDLPWEEWQEACTIWIAASVKRAKTVEEVQQITAELLTYQKNIKHLMMRGVHFQAYDRHFRKDQEYVEVSWTAVRHDLLFEYPVGARDNQVNSSSRNDGKFTSGFESSSKNLLEVPQNSKVPYGRCFRFHSPGKYCEKEHCKWSHECPCGGSHPMYRCNNKAGQDHSGHFD